MDDLQEIMENNAGIVSTKDEMEKGLELLQELKNREKKFALKETDNTIRHGIMLLI